MLYPPTVHSIEIPPSFEDYSLKHINNYVGHHTVSRYTSLKRAAASSHIQTLNSRTSFSLNLSFLKPLSTNDKSILGFFAVEGYIATCNGVRGSSRSLNPNWVDHAEFRLVMFRPFLGEILSGEVEEFDDKGLRLSLGFFKDIVLPVHALPNPSKFTDGRWTWDYNGIELTIEKEEEIRFRVLGINYPPIPVEQEKDAKPFAPMVINASIDFDGLGPVSWWV